MLLLGLLWKACLENAAFDKVLIKDFKANRDLFSIIREFYKNSKFSEDERIKFNWFIGRTFDVCINDLR